MTTLKNTFSAPKGGIGFIILNNTPGKEDGVPTSTIWRITAFDVDSTTIYFNDQASGMDKYERITENRTSVTVPYAYMDVLKAFHTAGRGYIVDLGKVCKTTKPLDTYLNLNYRQVDF